MIDKIIDFTFSKEFSATVFSVIVVTLIVFAAVTHKAEARGGKTLKTDVYETERGTLVEVVTVPGFGKCMLTSANTICEEGK